MTLCFVWLIADVVHKFILLPIPQEPETLIETDKKSAKPAKQSFVCEFVQALQIPLLCMVVMSIYQYCLLFRGLTDYIINAPRGSSFFASNREGILSLCGYTPMYLMAEWFSGHYFFNQSANKSTKSTNNINMTTNEFPKINDAYVQNYDQLRALLIAFGVCGIGWFLSATMLQPTSRRLTNMPFVLMILCLAALMLAALLSVDILGQYFTVSLRRRAENYASNLNSYRSDEGVRLPSTTMEIMSKHQLVVFMIANVATGAVNMSIHTLYIPDHLALLIISGYMTVVIVFSWMFDRYIYS